MLAMAEEKYEAITMEVWLCAVNRLEEFWTENTLCLVPQRFSYGAW